MTTGELNGAVKCHFTKSEDPMRPTARPEYQALYQSYLDQAASISGGVLRVRPNSTYLPSAGSNIQCVAPSQIASLAKLSISFQGIPSGLAATPSPRRWPSRNRPSRGPLYS